MTNGLPASFRIPLSVPRLDGREAEYLRKVVESGWISSKGPFVDRFEAAFEGLVGGGRRAVAVSSGTAALHLACLVAGVRPGDEVPVPSLTFIATANAVRYCGARPLLLDSDPADGTVDADRLAEVIERRRPRAAVIVHLFGQPARLGPVQEACRRTGTVLVEDAAEALGAVAEGRPVGAWGDVAVFSFNGNKYITAGGGGMIVTANPEWADRARLLSTQARAPGAEMRCDEVGFNYRLSSLHAAVGLAQMERLAEFRLRKRAIHARYREGLDGAGNLRILTERPGTESCYWLVAALLPPERAGDRDRLIDALASRGIEARPFFLPLHRQPPYLAPETGFPAAEDLWRRGVNLPSSVGLTDSEVDEVIDAVRRFLGA